VGSTLASPLNVEMPLVDGAAPAPYEAAVRALFEAFSRREVERALELMHPDVVFAPMTATVTQDGEPYRGHAGIRRYTEDVERHWRQLTIQLKQIRSAGSAVVALGLVSGRGEEGSFEDAPTTWMVRFRDGLVAHVQIFSDKRYVTAALAERGMRAAGERHPASVERGTDWGDTRSTEAGRHAPSGRVPVSASIPKSASAAGERHPASASGDA
jgi:ketosteroid isomerase-like protein